MAYKFNPSITTAITATAVLFSVFAQSAAAASIVSFSSDLPGIQNEDFSLLTAGGSLSLLMDTTPLSTANIDALHVFSNDKAIVSYARDTLGFDDEDLVVITASGGVATAASLYLDVTPLTEVDIDAIHILSKTQVVVSFVNDFLDFDDEDLVLLTRDPTTKTATSATLYMDLPDSVFGQDVDIKALYILSETEVVVSLALDLIGFGNEDLIRLTRTGTTASNPRLYLDVTPLTGKSIDALYIVAEPGSLALFGLGLLGLGLMRRNRAA